MAICSECPNEISGRAKTCSDACRAKRHRRLRAGRAEGVEPSQRVDLPAGQVEAAIQNTVDAALAPVVREALTEDVLQAIKTLVSHTPQAIAAIVADLESDNDFIRQGAYRLLARYTLGHPALVPDMDSDKQVVVVVNGVARPQAPAQPGEHLAEATPIDAEEVTETRLCDTCNEVKPAKEFVGTSHRCQTCFVRARDHAYSITEKS